MKYARTYPLSIFTYSLYYGMKHLIVISVLFVLVLLNSCANQDHNKENSTKSADSLVHMKPDWDARWNAYYNSIEDQISLAELEKGTDSIEFRLWIEGAFSSMASLYLLKLQDTLAILTYSEIYLRRFDWDKDDPHNWDPMITPIVDSVKSASILLTSGADKRALSEINIDSMLLLLSQRDVAGSFGALDGESVAVEIANRKRYKFLYYNNPRSSYEHTKEINHLQFLRYSSLLETLAINNRLQYRIKR
jgi:hypothetical protein